MSNQVNNNRNLPTCEGVILDGGGEFVVKGTVKSLTPNPTVL